MIPMDQCKDGFLYRVLARNIRLGVWTAATLVFTGIRTKFGTRFLDHELHWDADPTFGTAQPVEEIEKFPGGDLFAYLERKEDECA